MNKLFKWQYYHDSNSEKYVISVLAESEEEAKEIVRTKCSRLSDLKQIENALQTPSISYFKGDCFIEVGGRSLAI
jgi:hypothetical protein